MVASKDDWSTKVGFRTVIWTCVRFYSFSYHWTLAFRWSTSYATCSSLDRHCHIFDALSSSFSCYFFSIFLVTKKYYIFHPIQWVFLVCFSHVLGSLIDQLSVQTWYLLPARWQLIICLALQSRKYQLPISDTHRSVAWDRSPKPLQLDRSEYPSIRRAMDAAFVIL